MKGRKMMQTVTVEQEYSERHHGFGEVLRTIEVTIGSILHHRERLFGLVEDPDGPETLGLLNDMIDSANYLGQIAVEVAALAKAHENC